MTIGDDKWSAEEIAGVDGALKQCDNAHEVAMALDRLFFAKDEKDAVPKLKAAGYALSKLKEAVPEEIRARWLALLGKQLRYSVDRAKRSAGKN